MAKDKADKKDWVRHNEQIRISQVLVIHDGKNMGVMYTRDALILARNTGLDLVEVSPNAKPPVCHIIEYGKFMYDRQKRKKEQKQTQLKEKEMAFKYVIGDHDLLTKANQIRKFLEKGMRVKCVVEFKDRQKAHKNLGFELLDKVINILNDIAVVETAPQFEGGKAICKLDLKKEVKK